MQAVALLLASVVIGLGFSAIQLAATVSKQRAEAIELTRDILDLADGGATRAAWTLDHRLAADVVASAIAITGVQWARIEDETGIALAGAERPSSTLGSAESWFIETFFHDAIMAARELHSTEGGKPRMVGAVSVALAPNHIAASFFELATATVVVTLIEAILMGLVLLWLSSRLITSPLQRMASAIADIDPQRPEEMCIPVPPFHRANELGQLCEHTNGMLERLAASQEQLRNLATRDPLTGLPNRALIRDRLTSALARADRNESLVAVLFIDLDGFKSVNDILGHDAGDELLTAVGETLNDTIRANDSAGRLGGDEFLVVLEDVHNVDDVLMTARRIDDALSAAFSGGAQRVRTAASIGIAIYPNDGKDAGTLMRHADLAMYQAKGEGGDRWHFFAKEMSTRVESRLRLETALRGALERNEFVLHYQPKFELGSRRLAGCAALLRWRHDGELLEAGRFVGVAEDTGIIVEIGEWILDEVCRRIRDWSAPGKRSVPVSVNVSARQLQDPEFVTRVVATVERHALDAHLLELEIPETVLMENLKQSSQILGRLRDAGIAVSIDDFGTGYSSLSYLTHLPINALKIDKSFVSGPRHSKIVLTAIIAMAKALQVRTVGEGVETEAQRAMLVAEGCDLFQGYLTGHPVPFNDFEMIHLTSRLSAEPRTQRS